MMDTVNHSYHGQHYSDLVDVGSFIDTFILQEFGKNIDAYRLSSYFYKDRKKKVVSGPIWGMFSFHYLLLIW